jgi:hypothetical protein
LYHSQLILMFSTITSLYSFCCKESSKAHSSRGSWHIIIKDQWWLKHHKHISRRKYWKYWRSRLINFHMTLCFHNFHSISWSSHSYSPFILLTQHFHASAKTVVETVTQVEQHCPSESHASSGRVPDFQGVCLQFKPPCNQNQCSHLLS